MQPKINFYQTRGVGETINTSIEFIKQNFKSLTQGILFIAGPAILLISIGYGFLQTFLLTIGSRINQPQDPTVALSRAKEILTYTYSGFAVFLIAFILLTTVVYEYIRIYNERKNNDAITTKELWSFVKKDLWTVFKTIIGLTLVFFVIMLISMLAMLVVGGLAGVTGIIASAIGGVAGTIITTIISFAITILLFTFIISMFSPLALIFNVRLMERKRFFNSISRCYELASGYRWKIIGLIIICALIQFSVSFFFQIPSLLINTWHLVTLDISDYSVLFTIFNTIGILLGFILQVFTMININFLYYSIIESKESVSLMQKIDSIGSTPTQIESVDEEKY